MGDVGMVEGGEDLGFAREPRQPVRIARKPIRQNFDRDVTIQLRVARAIHLAHAARAKGREDLIRSESRAGCQSHGGRVVLMLAHTRPTPS